MPKITRILTKLPLKWNMVLSIESQKGVFEIDFSLFDVHSGGNNSFCSGHLFLVLQDWGLKLATYQSIIVCRSRVIRVSIHSRLLGRWSKLRKKCGEKRAGQLLFSTVFSADRSRNCWDQTRTPPMKNLPSMLLLWSSTTTEDFFGQWPKNRMVQRFHFQ